MKPFNTNNMEIIKECQHFLNFNLPSAAKILIGNTAAAANTTTK